MRRILWRVLFLWLCCLQLAAADPAVTLLLIFNSSQAENSRLHRGLVELLKQQRAEGHFAGSGLRTKFLIYNVAEPAHAAALKRMGITKPTQPCLSVTELNAKNLPSKVIWRVAYDSPEGALAALDSALGLNNATTLPIGPAGRLSPPGFGFSVDMPYPIYQEKAEGGAKFWVGLKRSEGMALVAVANITSTPETRRGNVDDYMTAFLREAEVQEISRREIAYQHLTGVEVTGQYDMFIAKVRVLASDMHLVQVALIHFRNDENVMQAFFDSLMVAEDY